MKKSKVYIQKIERHAIKEKNDQGKIDELDKKVKEKSQILLDMQKEFQKKYEFSTVVPSELVKTLDEEKSS